MSHNDKPRRKASKSTFTIERVRGGYKVSERRDGKVTALVVTMKKLKELEKLGI